eukprot:CAMPEP_0202706412 /NCGR_PEP_ID=MMETSP1385-20130828/18833_1 /ASSEMBLY_ACC=CAM_ASM_000861 /TAXON_ID=933848 /ORGANISM="Elphidium margaritaceum" /LENGTH=44 /DNA_ID= /DNA_START= /DNA_END= /DNA_ORIENTATION=
MAQTMNNDDLKDNNCSREHFKHQDIHFNFFDEIQYGIANYPKQM